MAVMWYFPCHWSSFPRNSLFPSSECQNLPNAWSRVPVSVEVVPGRWSLTTWRNNPCSINRSKQGNGNLLTWFWRLPSVVGGAHLYTSGSLTHCRRSCYLGSWRKITGHYVAVEDHPGQAQDKVHITLMWPQAELGIFLVVATSRTQDVSCGSRVLETAEVGLSWEANVPHLVKESNGLGSGTLNT